LGECLQCLCVSVSEDVPFKKEHSDVSVRECLAKTSSETIELNIKKDDIKPSD